MKEKAKATCAEYERLRDLYSRKVKDFDDMVAERKEELAHEEAVRRHDLEEEIQNSRKENQDYVNNTAKQFNDIYNYYLNQVRLLMGALSDVAFETGQKLFNEEKEGLDLKSSIGQNMIARLLTETDALRTDDQGPILIGN